jgi:hypothetical protein
MMIDEYRHERDSPVIRPILYPAVDERPPQAAAKKSGEFAESRSVLPPHCTRPQEHRQ